MTSNEPLAQFSTATIADALDKVGRDGCLLGIKPLDPGMTMAGRAYTVRYVAAGHPSGTVGDYLDDVAPGQVVVLDNGGRMDCTVWGDILTAMAHDRGVAGTLVDGVCRDGARALDIGYPMFTKGRYMRTGKDRVEVSDVQRPVTVRGVKVAPGQLIVADGDGALTVPGDVEERVLEICRTVQARESAVLEEILSGVSLAEARARHGYHQLQRRAEAR